MFTLNVYIKKFIHHNHSKYLHNINQTLIAVFYTEYIIKYNTITHHFVNEPSDDSHNKLLLQSLENLNRINGLNIDFNVLIQNSNSIYQIYPKYK